MQHCHETLKEAMLAAHPCALSPLREEVVGLGGLEPPTSRLSGARSSQLSYRPREAGMRKAGEAFDFEPVFQHPVCQRTELSSALQNQIANPLDDCEALTWLTLRQLLLPGAPCSTEIVPCTRSP